MDSKLILDSLYRSKKQMEEDYESGNEGKYPPLYSRDFLFGKLQLAKETIQLIEGNAIAAKKFGRGK